jgi:hypothetical protein
MQKELSEDDLLYDQLQKIKALAITAKQEKGNTVIKPEITSIIERYKDDAKFLFAIARELEYKENIPDAVALMAFLNTISHNQEWQANRVNTSGNLAHFYNYFDYIDFVYSAKATKLIVDKLSEVQESEFKTVIYSSLKNDEMLLKDLLGTKYIRENQLYKALEIFQSIDVKYWNDNYNPWERGTFADSHVFDNNPFYNIKHTPDFILPKETFHVNKLSITAQLIKYIQIANNPKTKNRDYYYFLIGNCYLNMSQYGNSWMMRRFKSQSYWGDNKYEQESFIDEPEYRNNYKAQFYYKKAFEYAKTEKFKALCLRMVDFAEHHEFLDSKRVANQYPSFKQELSGCDNFSSFFKARR